MIYIPVLYSLYGEFIIINNSSKKLKQHRMHFLVEYMPFLETVYHLIFMSDKNYHTVVISFWIFINKIP